MRNAFMLRYGELALKGKNRDLFEKRLVSNIKNCLKKNDIVDWEIVRKRGRIFVYVEDLKFIDKLKKIFWTGFH